MGSKRPVTGRISRRGSADGRQYSMDDRFGKRIPGAANGRNGCRPAYACEGSGHRKSENHCPIGGKDGDSLQWEAGDRDSAGKPRRRLCALVRSDRGVRACSGCVSLLSLYVSGLCARNRFGMGSGNCARCRGLGRVGRPLGQLRLERRQRQHQQQQ